MRWPTERFSTVAVWREAFEAMRDAKSANATSMRLRDDASMVLISVRTSLVISVTG